MTDKTTGEVDAYTYDYLNRLTSMTVNGVGGASGAQYQYDALGNVTQKQEGASSLTLTYWTINNLVSPHAVLGIGGTLSQAFAYDANGNLCAAAATQPQCTTAAASRYLFDAENRLVSRSDAAGGSDTYVYDGRGTLLKRTMRDGSFTVYIGGILEERHSGGAVTVTKYSQASGRSVATRVVTGTSGIGASGSQVGTLSFLLADHLGSTTGVIDAVTGAVARQQYWPYGAARSGGVTQTDALYTGQQQEPGDAALGLYKGTLGHHNHTADNGYDIMHALAVCYDKLAVSESCH